MTAVAEDPRSGETTLPCPRDGDPCAAICGSRRTCAFIRAANRPPAAGRGDTDSGGEVAADSVLVEGDWVSPSCEAQARDLTKSWADAAQNAGCPASFVARMRSFVEAQQVWREIGKPEAAQPTPEQLLQFMQLADDADALALAERMIQASDEAHNCWLMGHDSLQDEVTHLAQKMRSIRALLDEWETDEPGTPMLAVMGLRRALGDGGSR